MVYMYMCVYLVYVCACVWYLCEYGVCMWYICMSVFIWSMCIVCVYDVWCLCVWYMYGMCASTCVYVFVFGMYVCVCVCMCVCIYVGRRTTVNKYTVSYLSPH